MRRVPILANGKNFSFFAYCCITLYVHIRIIQYHRITQHYLQYNKMDYFTFFLFCFFEITLELWIIFINYSCRPFSISHSFSVNFCGTFVLPNSAMWSDCLISKCNSQSGTTGFLNLAYLHPLKTNLFHIFRINTVAVRAAAAWPKASTIKTPGITGCPGKCPWT